MPSPLGQRINAGRCLSIFLTMPSPRAYARTTLPPTRSIASRRNSVYLPANSRKNLSGCRLQTPPKSPHERVSRELPSSLPDIEYDFGKCTPEGKEGAKSGTLEAFYLTELPLVSGRAALPSRVRVCTLPSTPMWRYTEGRQTPSLIPSEIPIRDRSHTGRDWGYIWRYIFIFSCLNTRSRALFKCSLGTPRVSRRRRAGCLA